MGVLDRIRRQELQQRLQQMADDQESPEKFSTRLAHKSACINRMTIVLSELSDFMSHQQIDTSVARYSWLMSAFIEELFEEIDSKKPDEEAAMEPGLHDRDDGSQNTCRLSCENARWREWSPIGDCIPFLCGVVKIRMCPLTCTRALPGD